YWHFRDIADFRSQILRSWQQRMTDQVIQEVAGKAEPDRLRHLLKRALVEKPRLDRAVRSWAAEDEDVATIVASVDARRVAYIANFLSGGGGKSRGAFPRAPFMYWFFFGRVFVMAARHDSIPASALDDISGLFEK